MKGAPEIDVEKIDFSQFHDLEHRPWGTYCRSLWPHHWWRSGWHHVRMDWEYRRGPEVSAATWCRWLHRHRPTEWFQRDKSWIACGDCGMRKPVPA